MLFIITVNCLIGFYKGIVNISYFDSGNEIKYIFIR